MGSYYINTHLRNCQNIKMCSQQCLISIKLTSFPSPLVAALPFASTVLSWSMTSTPSIPAALAIASCTTHRRAKHAIPEDTRTVVEWQEKSSIGQLNRTALQDLKRHGDEQQNTAAVPQDRYNINTTVQQLNRTALRHVFTLPGTVFNNRPIRTTD